jgi:hypothetical protein
LKPNPFSASDRSAGPILAAQPQVRARPVSVFFLKSSISVSPKNKKNQFFRMVSVRVFHIKKRLFFLSKHHTLPFMIIIALPQ